MKAIHADIAADIDARMKKGCKLMAKELVRKARDMQLIPTFSYRRPELYKPRKTSRFLARALNETREEIRSQFGLSKDVPE